MNNMKGIFSHPKENGVYGLFNDSFPPILDGVTLCVENYAHWFRERNMPVCVVTPWNPQSVEKPYDVMRYFSLPIQSRAPYRYGYPKADPMIWKRVRDTNFRIAHAHCPFSSGRLAVYAKKKQGIPLVGTFHSKYRSDLEHSFRYVPWMVNIIMKKILDFFNACDEVWIPQADVEDTVREYGYKGPLTVVENGNDFAGIIQGDTFAYKAQARKRLGFNDDEIALLFVGQHIWEKGIGEILDALKIIATNPQQYGDIKFRMNFIGNGYAADEIKKKVQDYGIADRTVLNGIIKDRERLSDFYAASDIFLFPSPYDNAPLVVREAAAMGTPAVLLAGSTASEVVDTDCNGFLVDANPANMAALIADVARDRDRLQRVAAGARNSLVRSWEDVVGEVCDRYETIIKNHGR